MMSDCRDLYQEVIIDHGRHPRNFGKPNKANDGHEGFNPLCGDKITLYIDDTHGVIQDIHFEGSGCAISIASASLMTQALQGKTLDEAEILFKEFHELMIHGTIHTPHALGKLIILGGVAQYPSRVKCATLAWHTLRAALQHSTKIVSTE